MPIDKKRLNKGLQGRGLAAVTLVEYAQAQATLRPDRPCARLDAELRKSYFDKLVASLLPLLEKLTTGKAAALISPDYDDPADHRPIFDWMSVINGGGIVYIGLDALSDYEVAAAVGNSMFAGSQPAWRASSTSSEPGLLARLGEAAHPGKSRSTLTSSMS